MFFSLRFQNNCRLELQVTIVARFFSFVFIVCCHETFKCHETLAIAHFYQKYNGYAITRSQLLNLSGSFKSILIDRLNTIYLVFSLFQ